MASTAKVDALISALGRAWDAFNAAHRAINTNIAYSTKSEDNPTGTLNERDWNLYLKSLQDMHKGFDILREAAYNLQSIAKDAGTHRAR